MRHLFVLLAMLCLAQCASSDDERAEAEPAPRPRGDALIIIGVAEAHDATESHYSMLWRRYDPETGQFGDEGASFEAETNDDDTVRVDGIPGEFTVVEVDPGAYALDSVFGRIRDGNVDYIAQGVVRGPDRPAFEIRAGEAVYLGIWQAGLDYEQAVARPWRIEPADVQAVMDVSRDVRRREVAVRHTETRAVACTPRRMSAYSTRQVC